MAAVFIPPSPQANLQMATRRPPLANVPNATNSPHNSSFVPSKRSRTQGSQYELAHCQPPPKKQLRDDENASVRSPRKTIYHGGEGKVFTRKNVNAPPTAFERKLVAARERDRQSQSKTSRSEKQSANARENLLQWQRHYRKAFPQFIFYFEHMTREMHKRCQRQVQALGAREEMFFSRRVTHVVTGRPVPKDLESSNAEGTTSSMHRDGTVQTVNPSLLDKQHSKADEPPVATTLYRAKEMGMKVWPLEKLLRMISTINETGTGSHGHNTRSHNAAEAGKDRGDNQLSQVLRNERINGPSDRDPSAMWKEIISFKGPFIYVHDLEEKTRPAIVREFPKVAKRQDGIWPQFRSAPVGKCPFIDEPPTKKEAPREKTTSKSAKTSNSAVTKSKPAETGNKNMDPPERSFQKKAVQEVDTVMKEPGNKDEAVSCPKQADHPRTLPTKQGSPKKSSETVIAPGFARPVPAYFRGEPAASGVQPSNITSAIRSQMISSTAAAPGGKAGTSKEVHELKRKVLEKTNGSLPIGAGISSSHRMNDIAGTFRNTRVPVTRAKAKAKKHLDQINEEDGTPSDEEAHHKRESPANRKREVPQKAKEVKKDPKPGYCENCRDKFDDFEEHVMTRKHRKFAANDSNWVELDDLIWALERRKKTHQRTNYD